MLGLLTSSLSIFHGYWQGVAHITVFITCSVISLERPHFSENAELTLGERECCDAMFFLAAMLASPKETRASVTCSQDLSGQGLIPSVIGKHGFCPHGT